MDLSTTIKYLEILKEKYNVTWWDEWDIRNRPIGTCYGHTVECYIKYEINKYILKKIFIT